MRERMESSSTMTSEERLQVKDCCESVISFSGSSETSKAWAHYYLGQLKLIECRESGALVCLWSGSCNIRASFNSSRLALSSDDIQKISDAKDHFVRSLSHAGSVSEVLYRNVIRSLSLLCGPDDEDHPVTCNSASVLILTSIGRQVRHHRLHLDGTTQDSSVFSSFDIPFQDFEKRELEIRQFFKHLRSVVPLEWKYLAAAIAPTGELLLTCLRATEDRFTAKTFCIFPTDAHNSAYEIVVKSIDQIIESSQQSLSGVDEDAVAKKYDTEASKRAWWNQRTDLEESLSTLIGEVEDTFFSQPEVREFLSPPSEDDSDDDLLVGNLASRFDAAVDLTDENPSPPNVEPFDVDGRKKLLSKLTVVELKAKLNVLGVDEAQYKRLRKADLIDLVVETEKSQKEMETVASQQADSSSSSSSSSSSAQSSKSSEEDQSHPTKTVVTNPGL